MRLGRPPDGPKFGRAVFIIDGCVSGQATNVRLPDTHVIPLPSHRVSHGIYKGMGGFQSLSPLFRTCTLSMLMTVLKNASRNPRLRKAF